MYENKEKIENADLKLSDCCMSAKQLGAIFCPKCGSKLTDGAAKEKQPEIQQQQPAENKPEQQKEEVKKEPEKIDNGGKNLCDCGTELSADAKFCCGCGNKVVKTKPLLKISCRCHDGSEKTVEATKPEIMIGKNPDCDLSFDDNIYVSRKHAKIYRQEDQLMVEDIGSSNGTFLKITKPTAISKGDLILIGDNFITVK